ncbi:phosphotransferase enzyme family protein [Nonomuraea rubra]|uniref:Ser/Thr protein kinase RdoA (MazF antagonist) n=2 Tax=Nonomuraea rubra TaxID=46180 RepID=A0A7X0NY69_9ACTN|nr:phosphotransferase [Nonomuraea rubra]MBB6551816.1 Ser/Thr protein kinase RdoA (MazF antagonist) [Nonomuraea rubra]
MSIRPDPRACRSPGMPGTTDQNIDFISAVSTAYGLEGGARREVTAIGRGAMGMVHRLAVDERLYAVKEFFWTMDEGAASREAAFRDLAASAGVRSPMNLRGVDGDYLQPLPESAGGRMVRLYSWVEGAPVDPDDPATAARLGELLGRLHGLAAPASGETDPWYEVVPEESEWEEITRAAAAAGEDWAPLLRHSLRAIIDLARWVKPIPEHERIMCHLDVQPSNVLADEAGLILLDWDDAGPGSPARELASVLLGWHVRDGVVNRAGVLRTLSAYRRAAGRAVVGDEQMFAMSAATLLNYVAVQARLRLDPDADPLHRENARAELTSALARFPSRRVYTDLLSVVSGEG